MKLFTLTLAILFSLSCGEDSSPALPSDVGKDLQSDSGKQLSGADMGKDLFNIDSEEDQNVEDLKSDSTQDVKVDVEPDLEDNDGGIKLRSNLRDAAMENHTPLSYRIARTHMYKFGGIDDKEGRVEGIYSGRTVDTDNSRTPGDNCKKIDGSTVRCSLNTEHSFAQNFLRQYLTDGTDAFFAAQGDIHHLFPSDQDINGLRWHFAYGDTDCEEKNNCKVLEESKLGIPTGERGSSSCSQGEPEEGEFSCVMQVRDLRKGDIARAQFYMAMRYDMPIPEDSEKSLRQWHQDDPPDMYEKNRNDRIEKVQGNRNPFVDDPTLVDKILNF